MPYFLVSLAVVVIVLLTVALKTGGMNQEYERAVLFRLGRLGSISRAGFTAAGSPTTSASRSRACL